MMASRRATVTVTDPSTHRVLSTHPNLSRQDATALVALYANLGYRQEAVTVTWDGERRQERRR
jgi:hypothetical protein